ncbi:alpha-isopropylmalate synthase regulatory domain-containing protein [Candidatus Margulisiibacteriota bacterium]
MKTKKSSKKVHILDTTLRDGEQTSGIAFREHEKLAITRSLLLDAKVNAIEVASARVSDAELKAVKIICDWAKTAGLVDKIEVLGFVDKNESVDWINKTGCKNINLLCKGSLNHLKEQLKKTPEQHIKDINEVILYAQSLGIKANIYLEDFSNGIINSPDYVYFMIDNIKNANRIMLPDTLGIWTPDETYKYLKEVSDKYPDITFDFHGHNDYGLATANCLAAIKAGIKWVHVTINGLGERAGNSSLASVVASIHDHTDHKTDINEKKLRSLSKVVQLISGFRVAANTPVIGENVFTQTCGVHADGDKKANLYFNKLLPERFGRKRNYALGKTSGKASIQKNLEVLGIELDKEDILKVLKRVVELGDKKENINLSDLPYIVSDVLGTPLKEKVKIINFSMELNYKKDPKAEIEIEIEGNKYKKSATGDGQYSAFMNAIKAIYKEQKRKFPDLVDYTVAIPPGGKPDALVETTITWNSEDPFKTKGVDSDQTTAAIKATINMLNQL